MKKDNRILKKKWEQTMVSRGNRLTSPAHWFFCPCRSSRSPSDAGCLIDDRLQPELWRSPLCVWPHQPRVKKSAQISLCWPVHWLRHSGPNRWMWYKHNHNLHKLKYISLCLLSHLFVLCSLQWLHFNSHTCSMHCVPIFSTKVFPWPFPFLISFRLLGGISFKYIMYQSFE